MRRVMTMAALAVLLAAPLGAVAQSAPEPAFVLVVNDSFDPGQPAWTSNAPGPLEGTGWFKVIDGGRSAWYAAQVNATGVPAGYPNNAEALLTSPAFDATGIRLRAITIVLKGSSQPDADILALQFRKGTSGDWTDLASWSGTALEGGYRSIELKSPEIQGGTIAAFQLRLQFTSDGTCDWTSSDDEPLVGTPPAVSPNPEAAQCQAPDDPEADPSPPGDRLGWFVDAVRVDGFRIYAPVPGVPLQTLPVEAGDAGGVTVSLSADAGKFLQFRYNESRFDNVGQLSSVQASLAKSGEAGFNIALAKSGTVWSGLLAVDEPDLVTGSWQVSFLALRPSGSGNVSTRTLTVTSPDTVPPSLSAVQTGVPVRLGPGQAIEFNVADASLRRVTASYAGLPNPVELPYPYALPESALPEGNTTLTVRAFDRAGHASTLTVAVDRDTVRPALVVGIPEAFYANVPARIQVNVTERTPYTVRLEGNGTFDEARGNGGAFSHLLSLTPNGTGPFVLRLIVTDAAGNRETVVQEVVAVAPITDTRVREIQLRTTVPLFAQNPVHLVAFAEQRSGVTALPVEVRFTIAGTSQTFLTQLPASGPQAVHWNASLLAGRHTVSARVDAPTFANETNATNQETQRDIEVFMGSVWDGNRLLLIRADARGLPQAALVAGGARTFPLELVNSGPGVVYRIQLEGNRTVDWDPLDPLADDGPPAIEEPAEEKDAPFPGIVLSLAVLALALLRRRRA